MLCNDVNIFEVLIVFKLTELSRSCSKRINLHFNYPIKLPMKIFISLFEKHFQENYVAKEN